MRIFEIEMHLYNTETTSQPASYGTYVSWEGVVNYSRFGGTYAGSKSGRLALLRIKTTICGHGV